MTAIQEPKLTYEYSKAYISSGIRAGYWVIKQVNTIGGENETNQTRQHIEKQMLQKDSSP
jgi:hypothetical protein